MSPNEMKKIAFDYFKAKFEALTPRPRLGMIDREHHWQKPGVDSRKAISQGVPTLLCTLSSGKSIGRSHATVHIGVVSEGTSDNS
jgi:hypothetical protein